MTPGDIFIAAASIADRLFCEIRAGRLNGLGGSHIRCAVAGYLSHGSYYPVAHQIDDLETAVMRRLVEVEP